MTQTQPDRLDRIETSFERMTEIITSIDKKFDIFQARTDEQLKGIDQRLSTLETRVAAQDGRLWSFVTALVLALIGLLAKLAFFPQT